MKIYRVLSVIAAATAACAGFMYGTAATVCNRVAGWIRPHVEALSAVFREPSHMPIPAVVLVQARSYLARQVKRSRPIVTPRWRMCPSA